MKNYDEQLALFRFLYGSGRPPSKICNDLLELARTKYGAQTGKITKRRLQGWTKAPDEEGFYSPPKWAVATALELSLLREYPITTKEQLIFCWSIYRQNHSSAATGDYFRHYAGLAPKLHPEVDQLVNHDIE